MSQQTVIRVRNLCYSYPDGNQALSGVSLEIARDARVALLGANGSGKSTLMLHLNGILQGTGEIEILGLPLDRHHVKKIRQQVGIVFQNPDDQLFCPTVFDDVAFGPRNQGLSQEEVFARVVGSLAAVSMIGFERRGAFHLSLGQKKRVALATVLAMRPDILLLDEPTANLDPRGRREIIRLLAALPQTMLLITHDLPLAQELCGQAIILSQGKVAASGATADILRDQEMLRRHGLCD